ncbi:MAG: mycofactocin biosynthesis chaperone MftB [Desulfobacterales bacterium]|nr:MAG: mycofactocin biosynthesis chaperone MftB [Desulfobacterales bacterium]
MCDLRYKLATGTQVREEDFGLLFYTMDGPRLYYLQSGGLLQDFFFEGEISFDTWMARIAEPHVISEAQISSLKNALNKLKEKGVILEC